MFDADSSSAVALHPTDQIVVPTRSAAQTKTSTAAPASSALSDQAPETSGIQPPPRPIPSAASSLPPKDPSVAPSRTIADPAPEETPKATGGSNGNVWPIFVPDFDPPDKTDALSVLKSALASAEAAQAAASQGPDTPQHQSPAHQEESGGGDRNSWSGTEDPKESVEQAADDPSKPEQAAAVWTHEGEAITAVLIGGSAIIHGGGAVTTLAPDVVATFKGQTFSMPPDGNAIKVDGSLLSFDRPSADIINEQAVNQATAVFTESGQTLTAAVHDGSLVLQAAGSATTIAHGAEAIFAGQAVAWPASGSNAINVNGAVVTMQALAGSDGDAEFPGSAVWTQGSETFIARMEDGSVLLLQAPSTTVRMTAGSITTIGGAVYSVPSAGGILVQDGTSITLVRTGPTPSAADPTFSTEGGSLISAFDAGNSVVVVVGGSTLTLASGSDATFGGRVISAVSTGGAVVVDGTSTISIGASPSLTHSLQSASDGVSAEGSTPTTDASNGAAASYSPVLTNAVLMLFVCGVLLWL
jgi:hypothetical protein